MISRAFVLLVTLFGAIGVFGQGPDFVSVKDHQFFLNKEPYYFIGTNYWYGPLLGLEKDKRRGIDRLRKELDFLKKSGVTNLRLLGGAEGSGLLNGVERVGPPLQTGLREFNENTLDGLDLILAEMAKRKMKAVIFFSNNWEWSGGFQQYLIWTQTIDEKWLTEKPTWDELRDNVSRFYGCESCTDAYDRQVMLILRRTNKITGKPYIDDPTIMAWELANEPRPMRPAAIEEYRNWIIDTAEMIKRADHKHLLTIGTEGWIGTENNSVFKDIHSNPDVDYLTIHIWPKNWGWYQKGKIAEEFEIIKIKTGSYLAIHAADAAMLNKPLVVEEFGLPRDEQSFDPASTTKFRDAYFKFVLSHVRSLPHIAGANVWAFGGGARPIKGQLFWKKGDQYMGDPPMEEQGLYSVFDSDKSTWKMISKAAKKLQQPQ